MIALITEVIQVSFSLETIKKQAKAAITELVNYGQVGLEYAGTSSHNIPPLKAGDIVIIGCSTSRVVGYHMGTHSTEDIAKAIMDEVLPVIKSRGLYLACQCCEHLNRAVVVERECMEKFGFEQVCVKPRLHAGGAWSVRATEVFDEPVVVEDIMGKASAGMDIGGVLIGMHMRRVAVPVHAENDRIGEANVVMARVRPKLIGGARAEY
ncbi:MAG: TIGR01440 family protein [Clostridia bacterium]|nr:TIGR01440 family protein [Clostridia bacterium]